MKLNYILVLVSLIACVVCGANEYDLTQFSDPTFQSLHVQNREVNLVPQKPIVTRLTTTHLAVTLPQEGFFTVTILSPQGRKLYSRTFALASGERLVPLDGFTAPTGMVLVDISGAGMRATQKMTIRQP